MALQDQDKVIKSEVDLIIDDIRELYISSGKKVSGEFEKGLKATYEGSKAIVEGYTYLAGRAAGTKPPIEGILAWVKAKGLQPIKDGMTQTSLAWAIARKIGRSGTRKESALKIYQEIITPQRIDGVIKNVSQFNVNEFVTELESELQKLEKNT